jgi:hypothetical protein
MKDFFKTIIQGLVYLVLSPFILAGVCLYAVYAFILFFVMFIKRIVLFFKGEDMKKDMRMDIVAKMHLQNQDEETERKELENQTVNVPVTNLVKEEKTTIVQPIIIQTDEEGRIKGYSYLNPNGQLGQTSPEGVQIETQKEKPIEALEEHDKEER